MLHIIYFYTFPWYLRFFWSWDINMLFNCLCMSIMNLHCYFFLPTRSCLANQIRLTILALLSMWIVYILLFLCWKWVHCWFMRTQIPLINYTSFLWNLRVLFFLPTSLCQVKWNYPENSGLDVLLDCNCFCVLRIGWAFHLWFIRAQISLFNYTQAISYLFFKRMLYLMEN